MEYDDHHASGSFDTGIGCYNGNDCAENTAGKIADRGCDFLDFAGHASGSFQHFSKGLASLFGVYSTANFLFLFTIFLLLIKLFTMTIRISQLETRVKELVQQMALEELLRKEDRDKEENR